MDKRAPTQVPVSKNPGVLFLYVPDSYLPGMISQNSYLNIMTPTAPGSLRAALGHLTLCPLSPLQIDQVGPFKRQVNPLFNRSWKCPQPFPTCWGPGLQLPSEKMSHAIWWPLWGLGFSPFHEENIQCVVMCSNCLHDPEGQDSKKEPTIISLEGCSTPSRGLSVKGSVSNLALLRGRA